MPAELPVVLVAMPFLDPWRPSIQLGLLKAVTAAAGFPVRTLHANLDFAQAIGRDRYQLLCEHRGPLVGEWLFSLAAFPDTAPDPGARLIDDLADELDYLGPSPGKRREELLRIREVDVPAYLDALVAGFPWDSAAVVGFTSTFQQNTASFALARRLKARYPGLVTVFGGANFEGEMGPELVRAVDCVDFAVIGEGDEAFPRLLTALAGRADLSAVPGLARRVDGRVVVTPPRSAVRLDTLPAPDYDEYFERAEDLGLRPRAGHRDVWLPIETARGCWWGAKHHCTFCGLNGTAMAFRSKSPERVLAELRQQARRYRSFRFEAVDNILDMTYLSQVFPALIAQGCDYEFFYEVKATLRREQLKLLAQAGVRQVQPGIESLSSHVLQLMRKGVRAIQNVNFLRWALYYDIDAQWNLLWGFPGETEQDYDDQAAVLPHLRHLPPPSSAAQVWLERFSPLFTDQDRFPRRARRPEHSYQYVYPDSVDLDRVAYFFEYELDGELPDHAYAGVRSAVAEWSGAWQAGPRPVLKYWSAPHYLQVYDERGLGQAGTYTFEDTLADLYLACVSRPTTAAAVRRELNLRLPAEAIAEIFQGFQQRGLMFLDGPYALALALPAVSGR